jgi:uncharacterized protein YprB with RNaseH-like and TPR domain
MSADPGLLARRLASFRTWQRTADAADEPGPAGRRDPFASRSRSLELAERLASTLDGELIATSDGAFVRCEGRAAPLPVDRRRLATLPGQPHEAAPLLCLDTETTGLGTATGTYVFLVGLGWWEADRFRQIQLLLPDQSEERAFLAALAAQVPRNAWLVTYNGRGFDWPLLVTRYRMDRSAVPSHAGHLDLLPLVRRLFRHRIGDARLRTVETSLLGVRRVADVEGPEIPGRYLSFLRDGSADLLADVVRHNAQDVRSLAVLLAHLAERYGDRRRWPEAPPGDLAGLARAFRREERLTDALDCLDAALDGAEAPDPFGRLARPVEAGDDDPWWSPRRPADFGGRTRRPPGQAWPPGAAFATAWTPDRILAERARLLRRLGRVDEALAAWEVVAARGGTAAVDAWIEVAKLREHGQRDDAAALDAVARGRTLATRLRLLGRPAPHSERDLAHRAGRLKRRLAGTGSRHRPRGATVA